MCVATQEQNSTSMRLLLVAGRLVGAGAAADGREELVRMDDRADGLDPVVDDVYADEVDQATFAVDSDPGSLGMPASGPVSVLRSDGFVYFEPGVFGGVCVFCGRVFCGSVPGGRVPGGTSVELAGAAIGGVLPSWLYVTLHV
jgi:hypothetical protein